MRPLVPSGRTPVSLQVHPLADSWASWAHPQVIPRTSFGGRAARPTPTGCARRSSCASRTSRSKNASVRLKTVRRSSLLNFTPSAISVPTGTATASPLPRPSDDIRRAGVKGEIGRIVERREDRGLRELRDARHHQEAHVAAVRFRLDVKVVQRLADARQLGSTFVRSVSSVGVCAFRLRQDAVFSHSPRWLSAVAVGGLSHACKPRPSSLAPLPAPPLASTGLDLQETQHAEGRLSTIGRAIVRHMHAPIRSHCGALGITPPTIFRCN